MAESKKYRLVLMGTSDFAVRVFRKIVFCSSVEVVAVYTQPDRPSGRGHRLLPPPVKIFAQSLNFPVFQPENLKSLAVQQEFIALRPDFLVVASYGLILPDAILTAARFPPLNVHPSLLPLHRGAAPVQRAIMSSKDPEDLIGVSIIQIVAKLDAGPVYARYSVPIAEHTAGELLNLLADEGAVLLQAVMAQLIDGTATFAVQVESEATYASKLSKRETYIDWNLSAAFVHAHIRAMTPTPGARTIIKFFECNEGEHSVCGQNWSLLLGPGKICFDPVTAAPGTVFWTKSGLRVACSDFWYELLQIRPSGGSFMHSEDFMNGRFRSFPFGSCGVALLPEFE